MTRDGASLASQSVEATTKAALPVGATGVLIMGLPISEWMVVLTIIYTILQIAALLYGWFNKWKEKRWQPQKASSETSTND